MIFFLNLPKNLCLTAAVNCQTKRYLQIKNIFFKKQQVYLDDVSKQRQEKKAEFSNLFKNEEEINEFNLKYKEKLSQKRKKLKLFRIKKVFKY